MSAKESGRASGRSRKPDSSPIDTKQSVETDDSPRKQNGASGKSRRIRDVPVKAVWHDFASLASGKKKRAQPKYGMRTDGQALIYPGKEHAIYGPTESGKGMLLGMTVAECLGNGTAVAIVDFEEGDELEWGSRLLDIGVPVEQLNDRSVFRYGTPASKEEADMLLANILDMAPPTALVIFEGVSAAYGIYGWQVKENDSATSFRAHLVKPCIDKGIATIASDHVVKSKEARDRYAIGGVMKLNMVNGAAYLLEPYRAIVRDGEGSSRLYITKDRPGSVKQHCTSAKDPTTRFAGTLRVKSSARLLSIWVDAPLDTDMEISDGRFDIQDRQVYQAVKELELKNIVPNVTKIRSHARMNNELCKDSLSRLVIGQHLTEEEGKHGAHIYHTVPGSGWEAE